MRFITLLLVLATALGVRAADASCAPAISVDGHGVLKSVSEDLERAAPRLYAIAKAATGASSCSPIEVHLVEDNVAARRLLPAWHLPPWAAGAAQPEARVIVLTMHNEGQPQDRERVFLHELAHLAITDAAGGRRAPRWFDEGVARRIAGEDGLDDDRVLAEAKVQERLLILEGLRAAFPGSQRPASVAYAVSGRAIELLETERADIVTALLADFRQSGEPFERSLVSLVGNRTYQLTNRVHASVSVWHAWLTLLREVDIFLGGAGLLFMLGGALALRRRRQRFSAMPDDAPISLVAASQGVRLAFWVARRHF